MWGAGDVLSLLPSLLQTRVRLETGFGFGFFPLWRSQGKGRHIFPYSGQRCDVSCLTGAIWRQLKNCSAIFMSNSGLLGLLNTCSSVT